MLGIKDPAWEYGQSGIVTPLQHEKRPHNGRAKKHFLPLRPLRHPAIDRTGPIPLGLTERTDAANRLVAEVISYSEAGA